MTLALNVRGSALVIGLAMLSLGSVPSHAQARGPAVAAIAAVVRHVAIPLRGVPSQRVYLAYNGKTPPDDLLKLVAPLGYLEAMPPDWRPETSGEPIPLLDMWGARRNKSGSVVVTATTSANGVAVDSCTYTVWLKSGSWQIDEHATQCLVL